MTGVSYADMAKQMDRSIGSLNQKARELNLIAVKQELGRIKRAVVFERVKDVSSTQELSEVSGLSFDQTKRMLQHHSHGFRTIKYYFNNPGKIDCPYW